MGIMNFALVFSSINRRTREKELQMNDVNVFSTFGRCCCCSFVHLRWQKRILLLNWNAARTAPVLGPPSFLFNLFLLIFFLANTVCFIATSKDVDDVLTSPSSVVWWVSGPYESLSISPLGCSSLMQIWWRDWPSLGLVIRLYMSSLNYSFIRFSPPSQNSSRKEGGRNGEREKKNTVYYVCVHFFLFWLLYVGSYRVGVPFPFFCSPWCDTHTHTLCSLGWFW